MTTNFINILVEFYEGSWHGKFKKHDHTIFLYGATSEGTYYALQCQTKGCPGRGYKYKECPSLKNLEYTRLSDTPKNLEYFVSELLDLGYYYGDK